MVHIPGQHLVIDFFAKPIGGGVAAILGMRPVMEVLVAKIPVLVGGLACVLTWRPSGAAGNTGHGGRGHGS